MKYVMRACACIVLFLTANLPALVHLGLPGTAAAGAVLLFLIIQAVPSLENRKLPGRRLRILGDGCELLGLFLTSGTASIVFEIVLFVKLVPGERGICLWNLAVLVLAEAAVFWNGIIRVYLTSFQLGLKWRILGIACGWIPGANLAALWKIISVTSGEVRFESMRAERNRKRKEEQICRTKYPLLLVHGVFFRDFQYFNYWGRIPKELEENGAVIHYGNHQSAASVADSAGELAERIRKITEETGCGKVNVIAHSKGGLDTRFAVSCLGMDRYVASLTTINTPHRGCVFADYLLEVIPDRVQKKVAAGYNRTLKRLGDENPDFLAAVGDLTASSCEKFNEKVKNCPEVFYQSVGSRLNRAGGGRFPLNFSHHLVKYFDGPNDGLVAESSFPWGEKFTFLTVHGKRGISHGDMIDLNREDIRDFDVREFYVKLVEDLKKRGF